MGRLRIKNKTEKEVPDKLSIDKFVRDMDIICTARGDEQHATSHWGAAQYIQ